jgi:hypothetical protein
MHYAMPSPLLFHDFSLFLSLSQELNLGNDASNGTLADDVDLRDVKHNEEKVELVHWSVLKDYKWSAVSHNSSLAILILEINSHIPEMLKLLLLTFKLWEQRDLSVILVFLFVDIEKLS